MGSDQPGQNHLSLPGTSLQEREPLNSTSKIVALLLAVTLCISFYVFRSNSLIGDGLRYLPVLRTISPGVVPTIEPRSWVEVYRNHYNDLVVHNHFLFGATIWTAFAIQRKLGVAGDLLISMQAVNCLCAAVASALFFLLGVRLGLPTWLSLSVTLGLSLSPAYLQAATNIVEVALALPFLLGALLLLTSRQFSAWTPSAAGVLVGLAGIFYAIAGFLALGIATAVILTRAASRSSLKSLFLFLFSCGLVFTGIWVTVLFASGYHTLGSLLGAIFQFPQEGTFVKFKLSSLIATLVGLTQAFLPVLPDDFVGLHSLLAGNILAMLRVATATFFVCTLLCAMLYVLYKGLAFRQPMVLSCLVTFLLVEGVCAKLDTYYQKLQLFALIFYWVMLLAALSKTQWAGFRWPVLLFTGLVLVGGVSALKKNIEPSQMRANALQLGQIVGDNELVTTWMGDVLHMNLYSSGPNYVSLPDLAFTSQLDSGEAQRKLEAAIQQATAQGRRVYFYGVFDEESGRGSDIYETRFREKGMTAYLSDLQRRSKIIARLQQQSGGTIPLYLYTP